MIVGFGSIQNSTARFMDMEVGNDAEKSGCCSKSGREKPMTRFV